MYNIMTHCSHTNKPKNSFTTCNALFYFPRYPTSYVLFYLNNNAVHNALRVYDPLFGKHCIVDPALYKCIVFSSPFACLERWGHLTQVLVKCILQGMHESCQQEMVLCKLQYQYELWASLKRRVWVVFCFSSCEQGQRTDNVLDFLLCFCKQVCMEKGMLMSWFSNSPVIWLRGLYQTLFCLVGTDG